MYAIQDFKDDLNQHHMEITFQHKGQPYFISSCFGPGILICGPQNDERVGDPDEALDKLLVDGMPMRQMMDLIVPD